MFGYLVELIIKIWQPQNIYFLNLVNLGHFFNENILYRLRSYFLSQNLAKFSQKKKLVGWWVGIL